MANIKVSELPSASSFEDNDYAMIVQSGENKKIPKQDMAIPKITKIWENDGTIISWGDSKLQIDISNYDFLIIVPSHSAPTIVNTSLIDFYFSWNGYYATQSKDVVTQRHVYKENNDIHWGECFYRGINGATGADYSDNIDYPRQVFGIKL